MPEAFVYCWTDLLYNKLYIGFHKGIPSDGYICSSRILNQEYSIRPNDFIRQIVAYGSDEEMFKFETLLLKSINAAKDPSFYNMHNNHHGSVCFKRHTEETKMKMSKTHTGKKVSEETRLKLSLGHKKRTKYAKGWKTTDEQRNNIKMGLAKFYNNLTPEQKLLHIEKITKHSNINMIKSNSIKATCPHCGKDGQRNAMLRWHFVNCKENKNS